VEKVVAGLEDLKRYDKHRFMVAKELNVARRLETEKMASVLLVVVLKAV
jgi:hypothetical protein